jgi:hypothetical protein
MDTDQIITHIHNYILHHRDSSHMTEDQKHTASRAELLQYLQKFSADVDFFRLDIALDKLDGKGHIVHRNSNTVAFDFHHDGYWQKPPVA